MVVVSITTKLDSRKIPAKPGEITATAGGTSILFLLKVPEMEDLTLQREHEVNIKELS
ncbi:MAG TPA: hypothetical protein P5244_13455 [Syntrophales bacterium]|nr:hypothetical protein [Syntrophales bacterium]